MYKLIGNKISSNLRLKCCLIGPMILVVPFHISFLLHITSYIWGKVSTNLCKIIENIICITETFW